MISKQLKDINYRFDRLLFELKSDFNKIEEKFNEVDERFDEIDKKFGNLAIGISLVP